MEALLTILLLWLTPAILALQQLIKPTDEHRRMIVRNTHLLEYISGQNKRH